MLWKNKIFPDRVNIFKMTCWRIVSYQIKLFGKYFTCTHEKQPQNVVLLQLIHFCQYCFLNADYLNANHMYNIISYEFCNNVKMYMIKKILHLILLLLMMQAAMPFCKAVFSLIKKELIKSEVSVKPQIYLQSLEASQSNS